LRCIESCVSGEREIDIKFKKSLLTGRKRNYESDLVPHGAGLELSRVTSQIEDEEGKRSEEWEKWHREHMHKQNQKENAQMKEAKPLKGYQMTLDSWRDNAKEGERERERGGNVAGGR